ncbi:hypothetical protein MMC22_006827 [Lobaria immixta]|nr:hypothetical protein [Lobaria immixta]
MQFTISASSFLFLVCTSALPHAFVHENSTEHVEGESLVAPISYVGLVTDDSEHHQLNGTVQKRNNTLSDASTLIKRIVIPGGAPSLIKRHDWNGTEVEALQPNSTIINRHHWNGTEIEELQLNSTLINRHDWNGTEIEELQLNSTLINRHDWNGTEIEEQSVAPGNRSSSALEKRVKQLPPHCDVGDYVNTIRVQHAIDAISYLPGSCPVGWGTEKCTRISCHRNIGITLCNDNLHDISPLCRDLAEYAQTIVNECQSGTVVRGQVFDSNGFNVIVRAERCLL